MAFAARNFSRSERIRGATSVRRPEVNEVYQGRSRNGILIRFFRRAVVCVTEYRRLTVFPRGQEIVSHGRRERHQFISDGHQRQFQVVNVNGHFASFGAFRASGHASVAKLSDVCFHAPRPFRRISFLSLQFRRQSIALTGRSLLSFTRFTAVRTPRDSATCVLKVIRQDGRRLKETFRCLKFQGVLSSDVRRDNGVFLQLFPVFQRPALLNEAMSHQRIRLFLHYVGARRRIRRRFLRLFQAAVQLICLVGSRGQFRTWLSDLLGRRADLQRQTFRDVSRRRTAIDRIRCTFRFASRINISQDVSGISFVAFVVGECVFNGSHGPSFTFRIVVIRRLVQLYLSFARGLANWWRLVRRHYLAIICIHSGHSISGLLR